MILILTIVIIIWLFFFFYKIVKYNMYIRFLKSFNVKLQSQLILKRYFL